MNIQDKAREELIVEIQQTSFSDIFNLADLQHLQDLFADAHGVASIITDTEGNPITQPSNFTRLCKNIIRKTEKGLANCFQSDMVIGRHNTSGAIVQRCLSCGLWDAGASINVGGLHIANWLIGQVRSKQLDEQQMMLYADEIGANKADFKAALNEVPVMPEDLFKKIADLLFVFANELSEKAYSNMQLSRQIAKKEKALVQLQEHEENLSTTLHSIGDGVIATDKNGLVIQMNPVAEALCGWKLTEATGRPLADVFRIINSETRMAVDDPVISVFEKGEIVGLANHTVLISKNGTEYQIADSAAPIKNKEGVITGVVLVFSDVTEKYVAQRQIKESEERYRSLLNNLEAGIVVHAPDTSIVMNNARASELLGLSDDQMKSKAAIDTTWKFIHEDNTLLTVDEHPVNRIFTGRQSIKNQVLGIHRPVKNDVIWVTVNGFPVLDAQGEISEVVISFIDVTNRKKAEEALVRSEKELKKAQQITHIGSWYLDVATNEVVWSEELYKMYGFNPALPPPPYTEHQKLFTAESWEMLSSSIARTRETGIPYELELKTVREDGSNGWMWGRGETVMDKEGQPVGLWGAAQDISERKQAEEELKKVKEQADESQERLHTYMNSIPDVICYKDGYGKWLLANNADLELFCLQGVDYYGKTDLELSEYTDEIYKNSFISCQETDEIAWKQKTISNGIEIIPTVKGEKRVYDVLKVPIFHANGERKGLAVIARDISTLYETQKNLIAAKEQAEEREEYFRSIFENSPVGKSLTGLDGSFKTNKAFSGMLGYSFAEFQTKNIYEITHPDDIPKTNEAIENLLSGEKSVIQFEKKYIHKNGSVVYTDVVTTLQKNRNGKPLFFITSVNDITERKHLEKIHEIQYAIATAVVNSDSIEQLLEFVRARLSELFDTTNFFAARYNPESNTLKKLHWVDEADDFEEWDAAISFSGYVVKTGKTLLLNKQEIGELAAEQNIPITGTPAECWLGVPLVIDKKTFGVLVIQSYTNPKAYDASSAMLFEQIARDLSVFIEKTTILQHLTLAKQQAEENEHLLKKIAENYPNSFISIIEKDLTVGYSSGQEFTRFNLNPQDFIGLTLEQSLGDYAEVVKQYYLDTFGGAETAFDLLIDNQNVHNQYFAYKTVPLFDEKNEIPRILVVAENITKRKQSEIEIRNLNETLEHRVADRTNELFIINKELEFHLSELEQFSYVSNHDLQEPLRTLSQFTQLFNEKYAGKLDEEGNKYVDFISKSALRMKALVTDLLEYSLLGKESVKTTVDCNMIVETVLNDLDESIKRSNARITVQELPVFTGYVTEIRQLFQNLIGNAIKYQKQDNCPEIDISAESRDKEWLFSIKDNGIGIDQKHYEKIFIIFQRLHNRNEYDGTGIGLANCRKVVGLHGGKIWVVSTPGEGSTFMFTIPKH